MRVIYSGFIALLFSTICNAECWQVGELSGVSARAGDGYEISKDGLAGKTFMVRIAGDDSAVIPNDLSCLEVSSTSLVCISTEKSRGVVETWSVDPTARIAFYTKATSGYGVFDGSTLFVGKVLGSCK